MQNNSYISLTALALLTASAAAATAAPLPTCRGQAAVVSGNVTTINISPTQQQGRINLTMTAINGGTVLFNDSGVISGEVIKQHAIRSQLDHHMIFSSGEMLDTRKDIAIAKLPPVAYEVDGTPCAFNVVESITKLSGNGRFSDIKGAIIAEGTISYCSSNNLNTFTLSGMVCLRN